MTKRSQEQDTVKKAIPLPESTGETERDPKKGLKRVDSELKVENSGGAPG